MIQSHFWGVVSNIRMVHRSVCYNIYGDSCRTHLEDIRNMASWVKEVTQWGGGAGIEYSMNHLKPERLVEELKK